MKKEFIDEGPKYQEILDFLNKQPVTPRIEHFIENQISSQVNHFKALLAPSEFKDYLRAEISSAQKAMTDMIYEIRHHSKEIGPEHFETAPAVVETYIWNKERIRLYTEELKRQSKPGRKEKTVKFFADPHDEEQTKRFILETLANSKDDGERGYMINGVFRNPAGIGTYKFFMYPFWVLWNARVINQKLKIRPAIRYWASMLGLPVPTKDEADSLAAVRNDIEKHPHYRTFRLVFNVLVK